MHKSGVVTETVGPQARRFVLRRLALALGAILALVSSGCPAVCGDGRVGGDEACDDDNGVIGDGCSSCQVDSFYRCDNEVRPSVCVFTCGDGVTDDNGEECDDGEANSDVVPDTCRTDCSLPVCGDGVVDPAFGEGCEPPGSPNCSAQCTLELVPDHGSCASPAPVTPGTSVAATLAEGEASEQEGSCRFVATPKMPLYAEAVFQLELTASADLAFSTDNPGTDFDTYLYVRGGDCAAGPELGCNDDIDLGGMGAGNLSSELVLPSAPAGTYFIFVDGSFDNVFDLRAFGNVELTVEARVIRDVADPCDPTEVTDRCADGLVCVDDGTPECENLMTPVCAAAAALPAGISSGSTGAGSILFTASCDGDTAANPEEVWLHTVSAGTGLVDLVVAATGSSGPGGYQPVVSLRTACDAEASEVGCGLGPPGAATAVAFNVDATAADVTVTVVVDGTLETGGPGAGMYDLDVSYRPVLPASAACDPAGVADRCGDGLVCLDPGAGAVCTPAGDCVTPLSLDPVLRAHGALAGGTGALQGSCAPPDDYEEAVFTVSTPVVQDLVISTDSPGTAADTVLYVLDGSCAGAELACSDDLDAAGGVLSSGVVIWDAMPGTDYYIVVDGASKADTTFLTGRDASGAFDVTVSPRPIRTLGEGCDPSVRLNRCDWGLTCGTFACETTPAFDECAGALDVTANVDLTSVFVDTTGAGNEFGGSCGGTTGDDVVVKFTLAAPAAAVVISTDNPGTTHSDTVLYARLPRCEAPLDEIGCNDDVDVAGMEFLSELTIVPAPAGEYAVFVDGWDAFAFGVVELTITTQ